MQQGSSAQGSPVPEPIGVTPQGGTFFDDIDQLSNSVVDLIEEGRFDEAETVCRQLANQYPDQIDGIERMAMLQEARGNYEQAAEGYRRAATFAQTHPGFDSEAAGHYTSLADQMIAKLHKA